MQTYFNNDIFARINGPIIWKIMNCSFIIKNYDLKLPFFALKKKFWDIFFTKTFKSASFWVSKKKFFFTLMNDLRKIMAHFTHLLPKWLFHDAIHHFSLFLLILSCRIFCINFNQFDHNCLIIWSTPSWEIICRW